jgi:hypothetical protein
MRAFEKAFYRFVSTSQRKREDSTQASPRYQQKEPQDANFSIF